MTANKPPSGAQKAIGDIAPKLADLTDDVLFGDLWERPQQEELVEMITHRAFYVGWPNARSAATRAKELFTKEEAP